METISQQVLKALRTNVESKRGNWGLVYLDNVKADLDIDVYSFRACLAALSKMGLYKVVDGWAWGDVKIEN
jgi:hypothetical protein